MLGVARAALLLLVLSLPFAKHGVELGGLTAIPTDALYAVTAVTLALAILRGEARLRYHPALIPLAAYAAAMLASALAADALAASLPRLAAQIYLLSIPVLILALVNDLDQIRRLLLAWLVGAAISATLGAATVILFFAGIDRASIGYALHGFGTLAPGPYPRLEASFTHPAMLCNYLAVSLALLGLALRLRWIGRGLGYALLAALLVTAAFTITPGLGGIALLLGAWLLGLWRSTSPSRAFAALALSGALAVAFVGAAVVTPIIHPTAPFLIDLPGLGVPLAPSVRLMAWIEAGRSVVAAPWLGSGPASDPIAVAYVAPSGERHVLTDAHNVFLNIAMHGGVLALAPVLVLIAIVAGQMRQWRDGQAGLIAAVLAFAWLNAFVYQGLTGSYEDARHLWLLLGLILAASRLRLSPGAVG